MKYLYAICLLASSLCLAGCLERTSASLPRTAALSEYAIPQWKYVGSFGGSATLALESEDPWLQRYEEGKFVSLAGIDANDTEVWACDLGISRVQVFDRQGNFLRSIGAAVPIAGTLPSDEELYLEEQTIEPLKEDWWEETPMGQRWVNNRRELFKAAGVALTDEGYWLADQMFSSAHGQQFRGTTCRFYGWDGRIEEIPTDKTMYWPNYIAAAPLQVATGEDWGNTLWMGQVDAQGHWEVKRPTNFTTSVRSIMNVRKNNSHHSRYNFLLDVAGNAGNDAEHFNRIGGMEYFADKLLVCDRRNRRIKVFNAQIRTDQWSQQIKIINARKRDGRMRFLSPRDLDIDSQGLLYLLDDERREVAILSPDFERLATVPGAELASPRSLALSPDSRHFFISDPGNNKIHHYASQ